MKKEYEVVTKSGGFVTSFTTEQEAKDYIAKNQDLEYKIKEVQKKTWVEYATILVAVLLGRFTGVIGIIAAGIGYYVYRHISKKMGTIPSVLLGITAAGITYIIELLLFMFIFNK